MGNKTIPKTSPWKKAINFANFVREHKKVSIVDAAIWANLEIPWFNRVITPYMNKFEDIQFDGKYFVCIDHALNTASKTQEQAATAVTGGQA